MFIFEFSIHMDRQQHCFTGEDKESSRTTKGKEKVNEL